jgi:pimeloyl-ACP methyl ester carboxylesterase
VSILSTEKSNGVRFYEHLPSTKDDRTFVLVHGLGSSLDFWNAVAPGLAQHRTIAFDVPGFGESDSPVGAYTLEAVTSLAESFLDRLSVSNAVLVGHSLGGIVALRIAAQRPDMIRRLVLIDSTLLAVERLLTRPATMLRNPKLALAVAIQFIGGLIPMNPARARRLAYNRILRHLAFWSYIHAPAALDPASLADAISSVGGKHAKNVLRVIPAARYVNIEKLMARLTQPVSLIWGQGDPLITQPDITRSRDLMPVDDVLAIPQCGHWPIIEKPQVVIDFLTRYGDR